MNDPRVGARDLAPRPLKGRSRLGSVCGVGDANFGRLRELNRDLIALTSSAPSTATT